MIKSSFITHNQKGFILPYTLFIVTVVLSLFTILISTYQNDIRISHNHQEQLKIETLIQMGHEQFKQDITSEKNTTGSKTYKFPPGDVTIEYTRMDDGEYKLDWNVFSTDKTYRKQTVMKLD